MNIFYLHHNTRKCAKYHVDRHVVKMILETCQLLCTAIWLSGGTAKYRKTHENHPCAIWTRSNTGNWLWLHSLGLELCSEYTFRYGKVHKTEAILRELSVPSNIPKGEFQPPPQAMPDEFKNVSCRKAYRDYYAKGKAHLHFWKNRKIPNFILKRR